MEMLDATLAFVLTIAALATIVTLILEVIHRALRVRKGNLISVLKKLNQQIPEGLFKLDAKTRWDFIASVLNNPTVDAGTLPDSERLVNSKEDSYSKENSWRLPTAIGKKRIFQNVSQCGQPSDKDWEELIDGLGKRHGIHGIYDKVSLEHVLRRFTELPAVKTYLNKARQSAEEELDRLGRKFEEFSSGASANFKRRSQVWSAIIGVILALAVNIDAARIFQSYLENQKLTQTIIAKQSELENSARSITERYEKLIGEEEKAVENEELVKETENAMKQISGVLDSLSELGVPIGSGYFPHCYIAEQLDEESADRCLSGEKEGSVTRTLLWILSCVFSGLLIGLGAPFWFDVAKRLSAVRTMLGGSASTEQRLSGKDAAGDDTVSKSAARRKMVRQIVSDSAPKQGRLVLRTDGKPLEE